jgi:NAD(P)-dependent dehydrogenase (short-subunit alcohol dehydrogenase family)
MAQIPNEERKTLILTGASRGIGHATVKRFSSAGWRVITCSRHGGRLGSIETDHRDWMTVFQVNFFAPIMLARGLINELQAGSGAVVNVSSIAGSRVHPFAGSAYATSKAALAALTREMAADFAPLGIRVNAISPGEIDTAILSPGTEALIADIPMRRLGQPEEVAKAIYFLCTEQSSYINGAELSVDGGQHV